ncbi:MAG: cell division protein FtsW [Gemmatimonadota bacterium]|nr:MAG: cell division protein FtsW [Gemmatimonadota bacterium]
MSQSLPSAAGPWETRLFGIVVVALVAFGVVAIYSASSVLHNSSFAVRQLIGACLGVVVMLVATRIDYHVWRDSAWPMLGAAALLLLILLLPFMGFLTHTVKGATRWLQVGSVQFQPSELAKFAVIVWTAMLAAKKGTAVRDLKRGVLPFIVIVLPVSGLVLLEPDLSTACLLLLLAGIVLFTAGAKIGHFLLVGLVAIPFLGGSVATAHYQLQRMLSFLSPGENLQAGNWQIQQSLTGFGSGRLFGVGFGRGSQKLGYLPEAHSDFIYSTIGEEWGFLGAATIVLLYWLLVSLGFRVARTAPDRFGMLLATGITALIGVTALTHIAVNLALLPSTGLPLPFLSDGRSNLVISLLAAGVLINIGNCRLRSGKRR